MKINAAKFLIPAFCLSSFVLTAQPNDKDKEHSEPKYKKTKTYSKSYTLSSSDKIELSNEFGEMKITTWEKNEIKVDATITGKSDNEARAQQIADRITIQDSKNGGVVRFKTNTGSDGKNNDDDNHKGNRNEGMDIDWVVYMPAGNALNAEHQFGNMIVPDLKGETRIECKFGKLTAGKLTNSKELTLEFGEGNIQQVSGGQLNIKFSSGSVAKLTGDVRSDLEFSEVKLNIDNDVKNLTIHNSYSSVYLDLDKSFSANWTIQTSHGNFENKTSFPIKEEGADDDHGYGPKFNKTYKGVSGNGAAKVKIDSSFGEIVAGHNLQVDLTEKKKNKSNKSNRVI